MKVSLGSWAFTFGPYASDPISWERTWKRAAEVGYDGVEICGYPPHISLEQCESPQSRRQIARALQDAGMGISGYSADFSAVNPTIDGNKTRYLDLFRRYIELCWDIGPLIRVDSCSARVR
jgi:sugar phosphate isomerase/epimerase